MKKDYTVIYYSNDVDYFVREAMKKFDEHGLINYRCWPAHEVIYSIRCYVDNHECSLRNDMNYKVVHALRAMVESGIVYHVDVLVAQARKDEELNQYLRSEYEKQIREDPSAFLDEVTEEKSIRAMMYDGFFDIWLGEESARPTEFVMVRKLTPAHKESKVPFIANTIDQMIEMASLEEGDMYTLARCKSYSPYLVLAVTKKDGTKDFCYFIPLKWIRDAVKNRMIFMISHDEVNGFYRKGLQE